MTLTNRLTLFMLGTLAVVLLAFSSSIYFLAKIQLTRQYHERGQAALATLIAAVEIEDQGLEWETKDRRILVDTLEPPPLWMVFDDRGQLLDGSEKASQKFPSCGTASLASEQSTEHLSDVNDEWIVLRRTVRMSQLAKLKSDSNQKRYPALVFVTATSLAPLQRTLATLASVLAVVSIVVWLLVAWLGRWVCRLALAPVRRMSETVNKISPEDLHMRLTVPASRDEVHELVVKFNDLLTRLQLSFEKQRRFTAEASHQLRTPLTAIIGQMEVALRRERDPAEYQRVLKTTVAQAERLHKIVEWLLFLARAEAEAALPEMEDFDLAAWLPKYLAEHWSDHPRYVEIQVDGNTSEVFVRANPLLLAQALGNLIDNALKYSPAGVPVGVSLRVDNQVALLVVHDGGPGIPSVDVSRVFEPFFRSDDARQRGIPGFGLGLVISKRLVHVMRGEIRFLNQPTGCRVEVTLPCSLLGATRTDSANLVSS